MTLKFILKRFNELSVPELYELLQLRSEVFVVEQNCIYQDLDGKDEKALHLFGVYNDKIVAYSRLFAPGYYFEEASIGRVVVDEQNRKNKWGHLLLEESIKAIKDAYNTEAITISAQLYLKKFYESHGFIQEGADYLEDGIPHIKMKRN